MLMMINDRNQKSINLKQKKIYCDQMSIKKV